MSLTSLSVSRRERAMSGTDAASLLSRLPDRLSHVVHDWAIRDPDRAALRCGAQGLSYGDLWSATLDAVSKLRRLDIRAGDRVALVAENGLQVVPLILALSELDAWAVPVNARMSSREVESIRTFSDCRRALYCAEDSEPAIGHGWAASSSANSTRPQHLNRSTRTKLVRPPCSCSPQVLPVNRKGSCSAIRPCSTWAPIWPS